MTDWVYRAGARGVQSTVNTTTTPLAGAATYTGTYEQNSFSDVCVSCFADVSGTLYFDFSPDGTNTNTFPSAGFPVAANIHEFHTAVKAGRYFRARFINDSGAQGTFRLYTYYGALRQPNAPLNTTLAQDSDAIAVRAVDTILDISASRFSGFTPMNKFGRAPSGVQTATTDIWDRADATPTQSVWIAPTQARIHAIVSSDTNDTSAGTGARTITVTGLKTWADTGESTETVTMNGTTPVNTANSYVIIHRMRVATAGTGLGPNIGTIIATAAVDTTITAAMLPRNGSTKMAILGIPSTQKFYITKYWGSVNGAGGAVATVNLRMMSNEEASTQLINFVERAVVGLQSTGSSFVERAPVPYIKITGPAILKMNGIGSSADIDCSAGFDGIFVDN